MTEIESRLIADITTATRARAPKLTLLRSLKAALHNEKLAKHPTEELTEGEVLAVLRREAKKRQEAAVLYEHGGRAELADQEKSEAGVIKDYLPLAPSAEEIKKVLIRIKDEQGLAGAASMGRLTKAVLEHFKGTVDGQTVSALAKEILSLN